MHRLFAFFSIFLLFLGCNRPISNPETIDPVYADIQKQIEVAKKELDTFKKELEPIKRDIREARPQTGELKLRYSELYETEDKIVKGEQKIKYLTLRLETRKKLGAEEYLKAFEKGEPWPKPEDIQKYQANRRLVTAPRSWDEHLKQTLPKREPATKKAEKKAPSGGH